MPTIGHSAGFRGVSPGDLTRLAHEVELQVQVEGVGKQLDADLPAWSQHVSSLAAARHVDDRGAGPKQSSSACIGQEADWTSLEEVLSEVGSRTCRQPGRRR